MISTSLLKKDNLNNTKDSALLRDVYMYASKTKKYLYLWKFMLEQRDLRRASNVYIGVVCIRILSTCIVQWNKEDYRRLEDRSKLGNYNPVVFRLVLSRRIPSFTSMLPKTPSSLRLLARRLTPDLFRVFPAKTKKHEA